MSRQAVVWLIPSLLTVHGVEEAIAFRRSWPIVHALWPPLSYGGLLTALFALSAIAFLLAYFATTRSSAFWLLLAIEAAVALNVLAHLAAATLIFRGYAPGLITALAINAPFAVYCFSRATRERWFSRGALMALAPAALVLHGPVLVAGLWLAGTLNR